jgi:hypothetical protein
MALNGIARVLKGFQALSGEINLASAGSFTVVPAMSGRLFIARRAFLRIMSESGNSTPATIKLTIGGVDMSLATAIGTSSHGVNDLLEITLFAAGSHATNRMAAADITSAGVVVTVTSPANGVLTASPYVEGYLL